MLTVNIRIKVRYEGSSGIVMISTLKFVMEEDLGKGYYSTNVVCVIVNTTRWLPKRLVSPANIIPSIGTII
jgi:hypothetical protein